MKQPQVTPNSIILNRFGPEIHVPIRLSKRAKRIAIRINTEGPELILPHKKDQYNSGEKFLLSKESWIRLKLRNRPTPEQIDDKAIPIFGDMHSLSHVQANQFQVKIEDNLIEIHSNYPNNNTILIVFLRNKLLSEITKLVDFFSEKHSLKYSHIRIMDNKSKWGSCCSKGRLSFNWRLVFAPHDVLKYLVVHEMCHIKEMNHSEHFWGLVEELYPGYKAPKFWLKKNGCKLHGYLQSKTH
mgnify:FL=1